MTDAKQTETPDKDDAHTKENVKTGMNLGAKLFWMLLIGGAGLFLYTANEGQDNMFEDFAEVFEKAKNKVVSLGRASPQSIAAQIIQSGLKSPKSFDLNKSTVLWTGQTKIGEPAHIVLIDYSALNGFGGATRGCTLISFRHAENGQAKWNRTYGIQTLQTSTCQANLTETQKRDLANIYVKANAFKAN